jgi:uncharacterized protein YbaP (TraB family)
MFFDQLRLIVQKQTIMKKISLFIAALVTISSTLFAQSKDAKALLWKIERSKQAEQLQTTLLDFNSFVDETNTMLDIYRRHDVQEMYNYTLQHEMSEDGAGAMLLDHRNKNWIPVIQAAVKEKPTFIAVGAAHLGGENGVIQLLRKAGYKVTPIF